VLNDVLKYSKELGFMPQSATIEDISFEYKGYTIPYGYYKFLGDFSMFKPDGTASPHDTLSLNNYDFDKAESFFADAEGLRRNEILQQFANGEERQKYRDSDLTAEQLADVVNQKRKEVAESIVAPVKDSLSNEGEEFAPIGNYSTPLNETALEQDIAPVKEDVAPKKTTTTKADLFTEDFAPVTAEEAEALSQERFDSLTDADVPPVTEATRPVTDESINPMADRDINTVGNRKVKAYQYENPEVKPFFQEMANIMLGELKRSTRGERLYYQTEDFDYGVTATKRETTADIEYLLDNLHYTYKQIEDGLKAIIEDGGEENNACSK
jgi:hypothetical protein